MTDSTIATITPKDLHELLGGAAEFALVDVRETRATVEEGSILLAVTIPLSQLELRVDALVPRRSAPVIVYDTGTGDLAERAAWRLRQLGYTDVAVLADGIRGWAEAGFKVHAGGDHVVGQAFGEWIEEEYRTPHISVPEYLERLAAGEDIVLLDSRPLPEFENHSLPGGTSVPGAELVYRARELVSSPDSLVVVHCAGRTRSILGAQVLINAGLPNQVVSLEGGTQAWILEGHEVDHGRSASAPPPSAATLAAAKADAARIAERFGVVTIDHATLARFRAESGQRSLYVLDVRSPQEFADGHLPGSRSAPSWDVAPWVFRHVGTHNARVVLVDNDTVRATVAASWIIQTGWAEVFVLADALTGQALEAGPVPPTVLGLPDDAGYAVISARELRDLRATGGSPLVIDLQPSPSYRGGHLPGAVFALRSRLAETVSAGRLPGDGLIVLTSPDGVLARLAAVDLAGVTGRPVRVLHGGTAAWQQAGFPLEAGDGTFLHAPDDADVPRWNEPDPERQKAAFRRYLAWELGLVAELRADDTVPFKRFADSPTNENADRRP